MRLNWNSIFAVLLLVLMVVFFGCGEDEPVEDLKDTDAKKNIWKKDGAEMVLIPAGSFEMGDHFSGEDGRDELPVHKVELDAFYMDVNEVTVGQFKQFVEESGYAYNRWQDVTKYSPEDDYPMIYMNWDDATSYAEWAGKRLPTEAQWEYAARGGLEGKRYLWGDDLEMSIDYANYGGLVKWGTRIGDTDKWEYCAPVGSFRSNRYGLYDMVGNVSEWCSDWHNADYYTQSPSSNPQGPSSATKPYEKVLRGGSWSTTNGIHLRVAARASSHPSKSYNNRGFRCVIESPAAKQ